MVGAYFLQNLGVRAAYKHYLQHKKHEIKDGNCKEYLNPSEGCMASENSDV